MILSAVLAYIEAIRNGVRVVNLHTLIDAYLWVINGFNLMVMLVTIIPGYFSFKKIFVKLYYDAVNRIHSIPYLVSTVSLSLVILCTALMMEGDTVRGMASGYTFAITLFLQTLSDRHISLGRNRLVELEEELDRQAIMNFQPLPPAVIQTAVAPIDAILRPLWIGLEHIQPKNEPGLFVMNHSLLGLEMASFVSGLYSQTGVYTRGLGDHFHFQSPHAGIMRTMGAVDGTRENVDCLMESKQSILVYPGGAHEILKHSSIPKYSLLWKDRLGFARMAIKHGYPIIPCAAVGTEDMLDILADIPAGWVSRGLTIPIVGGVHPKKIQRVYFWIGEPIMTAQYKGDWQDDTLARHVRDQTRDAVQRGIALLQDRQRKDPDRYLLYRQKVDDEPKPSSSSSSSLAEKKAK